MAPMYFEASKKYIFFHQNETLNLFLQYTSMHNGFVGVFSGVYIRSDVFFFCFRWFDRVMWFSQQVQPVRLMFLLTTLTTPNQGGQDVRFVFDCVLHD